MPDPNTALAYPVISVPVLPGVGDTVDTALNDSDKTATVPAGKEWTLFGVFAQLITTATVGNRQIELLIDDGTNNLYILTAGAVQAASLTRTYSFGPGLADLTAFRDTTRLTTPMPASLLLAAGYRITVKDNKAIDAAADDLTLIIHRAERTA